MHSFTGYGSVSEEQTGLDVLRLQHWVFIKDHFRGIAGRQHSQDVLHGDSHVADDWLAAEDVGAHGNPVHQLGMRRHQSRSSWAGDFPQSRCQKQGLQQLPGLSPQG